MSDTHMQLLFQTHVEEEMLYRMVPEGQRLPEGEKLSAGPIRKTVQGFERFFFKDREIIEAIWSNARNVWVAWPN